MLTINLVPHNGLQHRGGHTTAPFDGRLLPTALSPSTLPRVIDRHSQPSICLADRVFTLASVLDHGSGNFEARYREVNTSLTYVNVGRLARICRKAA